MHSRTHAPTHLQSTRRVYNTFLALDADMNGLLSCGEFSAISNNTMSHFFIQRIFEENAMRQRLYMSRSSYRCIPTRDGQGVGVERGALCCRVMSCAAVCCCAKVLRLMHPRAKSERRATCFAFGTSGVSSSLQLLRFDLTICNKQAVLACLRRGVDAGLA